MSRALFSIKQVKHILPMESLRTLYFALIHPHLSYGIIAWGSADKSITRQTNLLQKRAIRIITNSVLIATPILNIKFWIKKKKLRNRGVVYNTRSHDQSNKTPSLFSAYAIENSSLWVSMSHHVLQSTYFTQMFSFIKHNNIQTKF